ncbi:MAG: hypothetical protein IPN78_10925 [Candidatus Accumulibacter sp.]|nr:hypothetical protein [Candidatus Accumulibacter propinquus]
MVVGDWSESDGRNVWLIDSGLAAGDRVIVDGVARIMMPNTPVRITPAGDAGGPSCRCAGAAAAVPAAATGK